jgi:hypothetical protein
MKNRLEIGTQDRRFSKIISKNTTSGEDIQDSGNPFFPFFPFFSPFSPFFSPFFPCFPFFSPFLSPVFPVFPCLIRLYIYID